MYAVSVGAERPEGMPKEKWTEFMEKVKDALHCSADSAYAVVNALPMATRYNFTTESKVDEEWLKDRLSVLKNEFRIEKIVFLVSRKEEI